MKNKNAADLHMQFDVGEVEEGGKQVAEILDGLKTIATNICESISYAFQKVADSMNSVIDGSNGIVDSLESVVEKMDEIISLMPNDETTNMLDCFSNGIDYVSVILGMTTLGFSIGKELGGQGMAIGTAVGLIIGFFVALVTWILANWDTIKEFFASVVEWINTKIIQPFITLVSEGIDANYKDMINYSIFAIIKLSGIDE